MSESEFYYQDELCDNKLLERANSLETKRLSGESIIKSIVGLKQENTVKKTKYDMNVFFAFLGDVGENKEIKNMICVQLDKLLLYFYISLRRRDKTVLSIRKRTDLEESKDHQSLGSQKLYQNAAG